MYFPTLDSTYYIWEIGKTGVGKAFTVDILHLSESSEYEDAVPNASDVVGMLQDARTPQGWEIRESTPKGYNLWRELWQKGYDKDSLFENLFFPWWWQDEYRMPFPADEKTLTDVERSLILREGLDLYQIAWRREMILNKGRLFFQEYPEDEASCWLGGENCIFDTTKVMEGLDDAKKTVPAIVMENDCLKIWKQPVRGRKYVAATDVGSGDPAGDYSDTVIMDWEDVEVVAELHARWPIDVFIQRSSALCRLYNDCLWGIERIGIGHAAIQTALLGADYPNLYYHKDYDGKFEKVGWVTSGKSRPKMILDLQAAIREGWLKHPNPDFWSECLSFVQPKETHKMGEAAPGAHDDRVMSTAIALQMRYYILPERPPVIIRDEIPKPSRLT